MPRLTESTPSAILETGILSEGGAGLHSIGKLDRHIYRCVTRDITTDEVIITENKCSTSKNGTSAILNAFAV